MKICCPAAPGQHSTVALHCVKMLFCLAPDSFFPLCLTAKWLFYEMYFNNQVKGGSECSWCATLKKKKSYKNKTTLLGNNLGVLSCKVVFVSVF